MPLFVDEETYLFLGNKIFTMIFCHILMISLFIIFVSNYLSEQTPDKDEHRIKEALKRISRDAKVPISDIKQKRFARKLGIIENANKIRESSNLK